MTADGPDTEAAIARRAGWRRAELVWERWQEAAHAAHDRGETARAVRLWRRAGWLGTLALPRNDPRRVTSLANTAFADRLTGRDARAARRYARAHRRWQAGLPGWVAAMQIAPRARSSLFHLRMEARHRDTYLDNLRRRMTAFGAETAAALAAMAEMRPPQHHFAPRWRAEKPPVFDDTRRFLAAALLIAVPG